MNCPIQKCLIKRRITANTKKAFEKERKYVAGVVKYLQPAWELFKGIGGLQHACFLFK